MTAPMVMIVFVMVVVACVVMITVLPYGFRHWDRFQMASVLAPSWKLRLRSPGNLARA